MSRSASKAPDDQTKLKKLLDELTKREENKFCADCGCRGPRWASINLGVFICIACSGIHRSLGVHLTFVRSVNLDSWTADQVAQMQKWGNARAKAYFEANVPQNYRIPNEQASVREKEMWIRDKYERKRFTAREEPPETGGGSGRHNSGSRKAHNDDDGDDRGSRRTNSNSRARNANESSSRTNSSSSARRAEPAKAVATTNDIVSFDVFSSPTPAPAAAPEAPAAPAAQAPAQDEWASFGGSSGNAHGFSDAFGQPQAPAQNQHANNLASIMASFGPTSAPQAPANPFGGGMMAPAPMGMNPMGQQGMGMNPMGGQPGMVMNPMGMNPMGMQQQPGFNPMMGQQQQGQPNPMMNPMFGGAPQAPMGMNPMMGGGMFPGGPMPGRGFPPQQQQMGGMGMNPMMGGMNPMGFQQQQQQQMMQQPRGPMQPGGMMPPQQQQQPGGLNQPFINLQGSGQGGNNPFF